MSTLNNTDPSQTVHPELPTRKAFLNFSARDGENLRDLHQILVKDAGEIVEDFYLHLGKFVELARFISDPEKIARLKNTLKGYLISIGEGMDSPEYTASRRRIGLTHERIGLNPRWYLGAYAPLVDMISTRIRRAFPSDAKKAMGLLRTLERVFILDAIIVIETYYEIKVHNVRNLLEELRESEAKLRKSEQELRTAIGLDPLTGINNRQALVENLEMELNRSQRFGRPFTVLFVDLDHFKQINDRYGHLFGDYVLTEAASVMKGALRPADLIGRYGGEEFVIGLVETDSSKAVQVADRIRIAVAEHAFKYKNEIISLTISVGLADRAQTFERIEVLLDRADRAMYRAKSDGRNRVCRASQPE